MSRQQIVPGGTLDLLTPDEFYRALRQPEQKTRVRAPGTLPLGAGGTGTADIYKIEVGYEFEVRRISISATGVNPSDPSTTRVAFAAGIFIAYLRSGQLIEYGQTQYGSSFQVPGVQTWGDEQGPYLRNGEVFGVQAVGLAAFANANLSVYVEGILKRPSSSDASA